jgi:hypothetical protein
VTLEHVLEIVREEEALELVIAIVRVHEGEVLFHLLLVRMNLNQAEAEEILLNRSHKGGVGPQLGLEAVPIELFLVEVS